MSKAKKKSNVFNSKKNRNNVFYAYVESLPVGTVYGLRVYGPYLPEQGHRFNHHKLLIDPYARQLVAQLNGILHFWLCCG